MVLKWVPLQIIGLTATYVLETLQTSGIFHGPMEDFQWKILVEIAALGPQNFLFNWYGIWMRPSSVKMTIHGPIL